LLSELEIPRLQPWGTVKWLVYRRRAEGVD
jgi:hypothetical protein